MTDHPDSRYERLARRVHKLAEVVEALSHAVSRLSLSFARFLQRPAAGTLTLTLSFTDSGDAMNAVLVATLPTSRQDGSALSGAQIASITFQKTSLIGTPPAAGPEQTLVVNTAASGAGLTPDQITYTDSTSLAGDAYTFFVTDTQGNVGALSNVVTNPGTVVTPPLSPPAAGTLAATFS